jgi:hypothetical protein
MTSTPLTYLLATILLALAPAVARSQPGQAPPRAPVDTTRRSTPAPDTARADTTRLGNPTGPAAPTGSDSLRVSTADASGADTAVTYSARDSMKLSISGKIMRLYGDAEVAKGSMRLTAGYIEIDFRKSELYARAVYDSVTKQYTGIPVFKDATQDFSALSMRYNFRTGKGITEAAETKFDEGYYFGERIKRVDQNTLFIQNGVYTTCDAPHPHYFFRSEEMKVVVNDKIYVEQPTLHVADVPVFFIPIGVFFAKSGGKQSGLIIPTWSQNSARGFTIERLGYFWAGNDYIDATLLTNLYSKGGYTLNPSARFRHREFGIDRADLDYTLGRTRDDPDQELETSHQVYYSHSQKLWRRAQLGGTLNYSTRNAIRQNFTSADRFDRSQDITTQLVNSSFSFSQGFDWGSLVAQYDRRQNIITDELTQRAPLSLQLTSWTPFARGGVEQGIFDNLALSYTGQATWEEERDDTLAGGGFRIDDTRRGIRHSPSISFGLPKIGYFSITPRVEAQGSTFFRRTFKEYLPDSTVRTRTEPKFTQTLTYGAFLDVSTTLYGIIEPRVLGINALRHTLRPRVTLQYRPDFGEPRYGYFDSVLNPYGRYERYSVFEADRSVAPVPGYGLTNSIALSIENSFEAKIERGDTLEDLRVQLLTLGISGSYNAAATEYKWSDISLNANTALGSIGSLSANLTLDPYAADSLGRRSPELLTDRGEGLLRVTNGGIRFGVNFSDQGFGSTVSPVPPVDSVSSRRQRFDFETIPFDEEQFFGDEVRGAREYRIPWTINLDGTYGVSQGFNSLELTTNASLTLGFNLGLTPTTSVSSSVSYDIITKTVVIPTVSFRKDLHCWEMQFDWRPIGYGSGFYFRLGIKSPQLRDIQLEREEYR